MPPGHPIILLKSNKFNMAAVFVKRSIRIRFLRYATFTRQFIFLLLTPKSAQSQSLPQFPKVIFKIAEKQIVSCESIAEEVSFEW